MARDPEEAKFNAEAIEAEKAEKRRIREGKKRQKLLKKRNAFLEKLIAPVLLLITVLISLLIMFLG